LTILSIINRFTRGKQQNSLLTIGAGTIGHRWARAHPLSGSDGHAGAQGWASWGVWTLSNANARLKIKLMGAFET